MTGKATSPQIAQFPRIIVCKRMSPLRARPWSIQTFSVLRQIAGIDRRAKTRDALFVPLRAGRAICLRPIEKFDYLSLKDFRSVCAVNGQRDACVSLYVVNGVTTMSSTL